MVSEFFLNILLRWGTTNKRYIASWLHHCVMFFLCVPITDQITSILYNHSMKCHHIIITKWKQFSMLYLNIFPCEARAEGPSVVRLINLLGRAGLSGAKPREFERKIYLYICLYLWRCPHWMTSDCLASSGAKFAYIGKNMRRAWSNFNCNVHQYSLDTELSLQNLFPFF